MEHFPEIPRDFKWEDYKVSGNYPNIFEHNVWLEKYSNLPNEKFLERQTDGQTWLKQTTMV